MQAKRPVERASIDMSADPHDIRKARIEDEMIRDAEERASVWVDYLKDTGNYDSYDGMCDCTSCRKIKEGFLAWEQSVARLVGRSLGAINDQCKPTYSPSPCRRIR